MTPTYSVPGISCGHCRVAITGEVGQARRRHRRRRRPRRQARDGHGRRRSTTAAVRTAIDDAGYDVAA